MAERNELAPELRYYGRQAETMEYIQALFPVDQWFTEEDVDEYRRRRNERRARRGR